MKRMAYLILAHHQPGVLQRLVRVLDDAGALFFIHIDGRRDLGPFLTLIPEGDNVRFIRNRIPVHWGGYSTLLAILALCRKALKFDDSIRRFTLLSGSDYPVRPRGEIQHALLQSDKNFIRIDRRLDRDTAWHYRRKTTCFHFYDNLLLNPRGSGHFLAKNVRQLVRITTGLFPVRQYPAGMTAFHGSNWWSLTRDCLGYVLDYVARNPRLLTYHKYVSAPDEILFHTLIRNSPFASTIARSVGDGGAHQYVYGLHYIDWRKDRGSVPKTLEEFDLPAIVESGALFARKMDQERSAGLMQLLDARFHRALRETA